MNLKFDIQLISSNYLFSSEATPLNEYRKEILTFCTEAKSRGAILHHIGIAESYDNYKKYICKLIDERYLAYTDSRHPQSPKQTYLITKKGLNYLKAIGVSI